MRVFVYEYTCALPVPSAAGSLCAEGQAMLTAVRDDLHRLPGVEAITLEAGAGREAFFELARSADWTLLIAPECDGLLAERCRWVEEAGGRLLGPSAEAVSLTADKELTAHQLRAVGVPTPPYVALPGAIPFPVVLKPRDGAGSQATFLIRNSQELARGRQQAIAEGWRGPLILQRFVPGIAASVAFLVGPGGCVPLLPAAQHLSKDGRFRYLGGSVPLPIDLRQRAVSLAGRAIEAIPGLHGYVGVDVVLGDSDQVIEINPRLTTSYVALRVLAESNLADAMLKVAMGEEIALRWREGEVRFRV
jgi:predicted ATP-grasp superfamily ATP-dependent carboligase